MGRGNEDALPRYLTCEGTLLVTGLRQNVVSVWATHSSGYGDDTRFRKASKPLPSTPHRHMAVTTLHCRPHARRKAHTITTGHRHTYTTHAHHTHTLHPTVTTNSQHSVARGSLTTHVGSPTGCGGARPGVPSSRPARHPAPPTPTPLGLCQNLDISFTSLPPYPPGRHVPRRSQGRGGDGNTRTQP